HGVKAVQTDVSYIEPGSEVNNIAGWRTSSYLQVFPGETITAQAIVMLENYLAANAGTTPGDFSFVANYFTEAGVPCSIFSEKIGSLTVNSPWVRLKKELTVPNNCTRMTLGFYMTNSTGKFTADEVKLYRKRTAREISQSVSLDNASFESYSGIIDVSERNSYDGYNWNIIMNSPLSSSHAASDSVDGAAALKVVHNEFTQSTVKQQIFTLEPDTNYFFEFWAKKEAIDGSGDEGRVQLVDVYQSGNIWLQDDLVTWGPGNNLSALRVTETEWTRKAINFRTPPAVGFSGNIEIRLINNGNSALFLDNVRLYRVTN
ncbi:MAG: hypothetical protein OEX83_10885, partial [Gammaproteobacteria bacterium]|nr:hypothetical protein [Gammaproteobacteria bacterium]